MHSAQDRYRDWLTEQSLDANPDKNDKSRKLPQPRPRAAPLPERAELRAAARVREVRRAGGEEALHGRAPGDGPPERAAERVPRGRRVRGHAPGRRRTWSGCASSAAPASARTSKAS